MIKTQLSFPVFISVILFASTANGVSKVSQGDVVTSAYCSGKGVAQSVCLPLSSQIWDQFGSQALSVTLAKPPTRTILSSGSGNYTPPAGMVYGIVRIVGAGGGGGGSCSFSSCTGEVSATAGGSTTFGSLVAGGGSFVPANTNTTPASGGTPSGFGAHDLALTGSFGVFGSSSPGRNSGLPGAGGVSMLSVAGNGGYGAVGTADAPLGGAGGGSGSYIESTITGSSPVPYSIGVGGNGGVSSTANGNSATLGQNGFDGKIVIDEFYQ